MILIAFAWLVFGLVALAGALIAWHVELRLFAIPGLSWLLLNVLLWNPIWRFLWKKCPMLEEKIFPDLNGIWDVELCSNWPRQQQLLAASLSPDISLDMLKCPESELSPLKPLFLKAKITQTWWKIEMSMWNPEEDTPIDSSNTIVVEPFRQGGHKRPGICYFYKQINKSTKDVTDDTEFYGSARLLYDPGSKKLKGLAWTARMWTRAINTAGEITFARAENP